MTEPFIGEIQMFGFNFNPRGWAFANGALIPIQQNIALFSLLGVTYGGNGQTTFQLPNFAARAGCQQGNGPGLSLRVMGQTFGTDTVTLTASQIPGHTHGFVLYAQGDATRRSSSPSPNNALSVSTDPLATAFLPGASPNTTFAPNMIGASQGGGQPHANQQPYLAVNFCIALTGIFPSFP